MIHVIHFYLVSRPKAREFVAAFRGGAGYASLRRHFPQLIAVDLLGSRGCPGAYLSIEFWASEEAYRKAAGDPSVAKELSRHLEGLVTDCVDLGIFAFPSRDDAESGLQATSRGPTDDCYR